MLHTWWDNMWKMWWATYVPKEPCNSGLGLDGVECGKMWKEKSHRPARHTQHSRSVSWRGGSIWVPILAIRTPGSSRRSLVTWFARERSELSARHWRRAVVCATTRQALHSSLLSPLSPGCSRTCSCTIRFFSRCSYLRNFRGGAITCTKE